MQKVTILEKGDFITVTEWTKERDNSYKGDCLEIKVIDLPFIRVKRHTNRGFTVPHDNITLDLRRVDIKPLSAAFVADVVKTK